MSDLKARVAAIPDFPKPGIVFRDISPLLRERFPETLAALGALLTPAEWSQVDIVAGIDARGFILASALAAVRGKGFVPIRKSGKLPPPVVSMQYELEYGSATLEMRAGKGRVLIVDDVLATGGTMAAAAELSLRAGYQVAALIALIDLGLAPSFHWQALQLRCVLQYE